MEPNQNLQPGNAALHSAILSAIDVEPEEPSEGAPPVERPTKESAPPARVEGEDAAPAEEQPSGEEAEGDTEDAPPAVEPPASWARDYKEVFKTLPPEAQQAIAERERDRDTELRRVHDETATQRKSYQEQEAQAKAVREQLHQQLTEMLPAIKQRMNAWSSINWVELGANDPGEYARLRAIYDTEKEQFAQAEQAQQRLDHQAAQEHAERYRNEIAKQEGRLVKLIPEWKDTEKGRRELADVRSYVKSSLMAEDGITAAHATQIVNGLSEASQISIARKAMLYDKAQATISKPAPPKVAPKVQKPGAARTEPSKDDAAERDMNRLKKTGNPRDAANVIARLL